MRNDAGKVARGQIIQVALKVISLRFIISLSSDRQGLSIIGFFKDSHYFVKNGMNMNFGTPVKLFW